MLHFANLTELLCSYFILRLPCCALIFISLTLLCAYFYFRLPCCALILPCCILIFPRTYPAVSLILFRSCHVLIFIFAYFSVRLPCCTLIFFFALTLPCHFSLRTMLPCCVLILFSLSYPAVRLFYFREKLGKTAHTCLPTWLVCLGKLSH